MGTSTCCLSWKKPLPAFPLPHFFMGVGKILAQGQEVFSRKDVGAAFMTPVPMQTGVINAAPTMSLGFVQKSYAHPLYDYSVKLFRPVNVSNIGMVQ